MTKLEEAALIHMKSKLGNDDYNLSGAADLLNLFIAGAEWLLEQASFHSGIYAESVKPCVFLEDLEKLCEDR